MPVICNLLAQPSASAGHLPAHRDQLPEALRSAKRYHGVYRYWHGIQFLLAQHRPESLAARWLRLGEPVSSETARVPAARIVGASEVGRLHSELQSISPEELVPHYDAEALDQANVYPEKWREWEEFFDPLGQVLEHYTFLQGMTKGCAEAGDAMLLRFVDDGDED